MNGESHSRRGRRDHHGDRRRQRWSNDPSDRRESDRLPFPAECVVVWNHARDAADEHACRYRVIDAGDGGYRIRSESALPVDMTGVVTRVLPDHGRSVVQAVKVVWTRPSVGGEGYEVGLHRL